MKKTATFTFGPWKITTAKGAILKAGDIDRISAELELPSLPEMVFGDNMLQIDHSAGFGIQFNAIDALKHVDNKHDLMKVAVAEEWQSKRQDSEYIKEVIKPFDWTFTTDYRGTLTGKNKMTMRVESTDERIDMEQLKVKEKIYFYEDVILFEDELADNGISKLNVKMRVMQGGFFLLLRFFMRVDGVLIRINDTRIYHKAGSSYMLREYSSKERKMEEILGLKVPITDPTELAQHLVLKNEIFEKLSFPDGVDEKLGVEQSFVNTVEEMEKAVLVPQSLQDMSLSSSNGVVLEKSLFESFTVLRNIKNIVLTGHALDDENGNTPHTPFSDELLALTETLQKLTGLANNLTAEYKEKFNLLF